MCVVVAGKNKEPDPGIIMYDVNGTKQTIPFSAKAVQAQQPKVGDKVSPAHSPHPLAAWGTLHSLCLHVLNNSDFISCSAAECCCI